MGVLTIHRPGHDFHHCGPGRRARTGSNVEGHCYPRPPASPPFVLPPCAPRSWSSTSRWRLVSCVTTLERRCGRRNRSVAPLSSLSARARAPDPLPSRRLRAVRWPASRLRLTGGRPAPRVMGDSAGGTWRLGRAAVRTNGPQIRAGDGVSVLTRNDTLPSDFDRIGACYAHCHDLLPALRHPPSSSTALMCLIYAPTFQVCPERCSFSRGDPLRDDGLATPRVKQAGCSESRYIRPGWIWQLWRASPIADRYAIGDVLNRLVRGMRGAPRGDVLESIALRGTTVPPTSQRLERH